VRGFLERAHDRSTAGPFVVGAATPTRARAGEKLSTVVEFVVEFVVTYPHGFLIALRVS